MVNTNESGDGTRVTSPRPAAAREDDAGDAIRTEAQCEICAGRIGLDGRQIEIVVKPLAEELTVRRVIVGVVCRACSRLEFDVLANGSPIGGGPTHEKLPGVADLVRNDIERMKAEVGRADLDGPAEFLSEIDSATEGRMSQDFDQEIREALDPIQIIEDAAIDLDRWDGQETIPEIADTIIKQGVFGLVSAALWGNREGFGVVTALARAVAGESARRALQKRSDVESPSESALRGERPQGAPRRRSTDDVPAPPTAAEILRRALVESSTAYRPRCSEPWPAARFQARGANFVRSVLDNLLAEVEGREINPHF